MSSAIIVASRYAIPSLDQTDEVFGTHSLSETHTRIYWWCSPPKNWHGQRVALNRAAQTVGRTLRRCPPQDIELVPKHKDFGFQRSARPEQPDQGAPDHLQRSLIAAA
jgi:hypothetical protein